MSKCASAFVALLVLALFAPTSQAADDEKDIRAVLDAQVTAWNKGDLDGFMAGYWNDEKLTFISGGNITFGWKATKDRYVKRYQADGKEMGKLAFSDFHAEVLSPTAAVVRGKFELTFEKEKDDKKKTARGRFTLILKKFPDGWKITHDHTSAEEVTPAPAAPPVGTQENPWKRPITAQVAPWPQLVPPKKETEDDKIARALLGCRRLEEAIRAYQNHPKNPGKSLEEKLPSSVNDLLKPPFGAASLLPRGKDELLDPWGKAYEFRLSQRMDGKYYVLVSTYSKEDPTVITQFGIGLDLAIPKD